MASEGNIGHWHPFVKTFDHALRNRCDIEAGSRLVLAVSGGADSVAMLRAIALLAPRKPWQLQLTVGHVQHHLREEAEGDAQFVESLAAKLNLPFQRRDLTLQLETGNLEDAARNARYSALIEMAVQVDASAIVTAHHGDDQLETLLMRLLRGTSVSGLRGIAWHRDATKGSDGPSTSIVRPMLGHDREAIIAYLRELDQPWREDHTNGDLSKVRARLRADVLPHLHDLNSEVVQRVVALTDHFSDVTNMITSETDAATRFVDDRDPTSQSMPREQARVLPDVVFMELLRRLCNRAGVGADALGTRTLQPIVRMVHDREGGSRLVELKGGVAVEITADEVRILKNRPN